MATNNAINTGKPIEVSNGGTGATTFTDAGVLIGNGTGAVQVTSAGTSGQVLTSNGAGVDPTFQTAGASGVGAWSLVQTGTYSVSVANTMTNLISITGLAGDTDEWYMLVFSYNANGATTRMSLQINASSSTYYYDQIGHESSSTLLNRYESDSEWYIVGNGANAVTFDSIFGTLYIKGTKTTGGTSRGGHGDVTYMSNSSNGGYYRVQGNWSDSSNQMTSLQLRAYDAANGVTHTGRYALYKIKLS